MSIRNTAVHRMRRVVLWLAVGLGVGLLWDATSWAVSSQLKAIVVDRFGNQHEVEKFAYQDRLEIEYYVGGQRRIVSLLEIDRMRLEGERGDEEQTIVVTLRTGRRETGKILSGANITPHEDAVGGGGNASRFTGTTSLGPFFILVSDVSEVIMRHPESLEVAKEEVLRATLITVEGQRFEIDHLRYRGQLRINYNIGRKRRFANLTKVAKIDFAEGSASEEMRPVTIVYWSGKTLQGSVDASTVRLSGETDRNYYERVNAAITGRTKAGAFAIGFHAIKQIRFHPPDEEEVQEGKLGEDEAKAVGEKPAEEDSGKVENAEGDVEKPTSERP